LLNDPALEESCKKVIGTILGQNRRVGIEPFTDSITTFKIGMLVRTLFSCLIDADRIDTADFESPKQAKFRQHGVYRTWNELADRLERHLQKFKGDNPVDSVRQEVSQNCLNRSSSEQGIYTLTVPTGGGKTLASLRFALAHAEKHNLDRIIYVIPFTSIIDQNAQVVREILEDKESDHFGSVVLEHHSNLTPEEQSWRAKILSESWDAPIIYSLRVQARSSFIRERFARAGSNAKIFRLLLFRAGKRHDIPREFEKRGDWM